MLLNILYEEVIKNETKNMGKSTELEEKCENGLMIADYCGKVKDDYSQNKEDWL